MKNILTKALLVTLGTTMFYACNPEEGVMTDLNKLDRAIKSEQLTGCEKITFDNFTRGENNFVSEVKSDMNSGPILVSAFRKTASNTYSTTNVANIFNSGQVWPVGFQVDDILTPNLDFGGGGFGDGGKLGSLYKNDLPLGNLLIINRSDNYLMAYDNNGGGKIVCDFSALGTVTLKSVTVLDIDDYENGSKVMLYDINSIMIKEVMMAVSGSNGKQIVDLANTSGVVKMEIILGPGGVLTGSGAIDNIEFCKDVPEEYGCTLTQGYWKTHGEAGSKKFDATWGNLPSTTFYGSGMTYLQLMGQEPKNGNAYIMLAHQYIAAVLNMKKASSPTEVKDAVDNATAYFSAMQGSSYLNTISTPYTTVQREELIAWAAILANYNEGKVGPGHCD